MNDFIDFKKLQLDEWNKLNSDERNYILKSLENYKNHKFTLKEIKSFGENDNKFETGIFDLDGSEFVFIPGKTTIIGYDEKITTEKIKKLFEEELNKYFNDEYAELSCTCKTSAEFYKLYMSPLRNVNIKPMLVERDKVEIKAGYISDIWNEEENSKFSLIKYNSEMRELHINKEYTISNIKECINKTDFSLITEDEWEYLSGGECNDIFLNEVYKKIEDGYETDEDYFKLDYTPNRFGIFINYNKTQTELVDSPCQCKGCDFGDIVYSESKWIDNLTYSTHYRSQQYQDENQEMSEYFDTYVRRVVRIEQ